MAAKAETAAYVTFLAGDGGDSWKDVVGLGNGLSKVGSAYPLVVAVLPDVPESHRRILISQGCIVREVQPLNHPPLENQQTTQFVNNYSKLRIWEFVEYERMVYLDPGTQVLDNIDGLFDLEKDHFYAVLDGFCDKVGWWPTAELGPPPAPHFNAGVFVHEPSMETTKALLHALRVTPVTPFADQDFLNMFFKDEYNFVLDNTLLSHPGNEGMTNKAKAVHVHNYAARLEEEKLPPPPFASWLATTTTTVFARQNLPAMATLAASSAALGVVLNAADPAICFAFYAVFLAAIATVTLSFRGI